MSIATLCQTLFSVIVFIFFNFRNVDARTDFLFGKKTIPVLLSQSRCQISSSDTKVILNGFPQKVQQSWQTFYNLFPIEDIKESKPKESSFKNLLKDSFKTLTNTNNISSIPTFCFFICKHHELCVAVLGTKALERNVLLSLLKTISKGNLGNQETCEQNRSDSVQNWQHYIFLNATNPCIWYDEDGILKLYPIQISISVRNKKIKRTHSNVSNPYINEVIRETKIETYQSEASQQTNDLKEQNKQTQTNSNKNTIQQKKKRIRRDGSNGEKFASMVYGGLLPVALTIMGKNGELSTGRALLHHITFLLKNATRFESIDKPYGGIFLNENDFGRIINDSMNLTDPVILTIFGINALNNSSLLSNTYINDYLNCIDHSREINKYKALQNKIDCMKRKLFGKNNYEPTESSRYPISNLPAELVYTDVMSNIQNLVRSKSNIAYYSLPVNELAHLHQVVLPIEEFVSKIHNAHFSPNNLNRNLFLNGNVDPRIWYIVKPDGRIYQTEASQNYYPTTIYHGFPDIPNADTFVDRGPKGLYYESSEDHE